ncbi:energy-coupling factor transporter ATP-binding protein EcfA2 [Lysinibacillus composti]|uniref:AAA+ ATPase domain-containing protein n=1 Tax=Lysinibacillus composti TaxID=720633 RepID=A0A3N9UCY8_9BACI|nr:AAA family ATPase [Lysinibacillus composti]MBM7609147.1 energy-coupling factor transporter ATP-binding protein EcfA2 [Lysinibacillus composti]RQW74204.1 hypothetical protein EBB45_12660 [Lysinibacillus composti]
MDSYEEWLIKQNLSDSSKGNYIRAINFLKAELNNAYTKELFESDDLSAIDKLLKEKAFIEINNRHHHVYSAALRHYRKYIEETAKSDKDMDGNSQSIKDEIIEALKELGGSGSLEEIYNSVKNRNILDLNKYKDWRAQIRKVIYLYSSDADKVFKGQPRDYNDIFYAIQGKGNGIWGLRNFGQDPRNGNSEDKEVKLMELNNVELIEHIYSYISSIGFSYSYSNIKNLFLSIRSKPFVIISGISGTGKTKIVQLFAEAIGATEKNGQFKLIPVRPDWSDSSDLLGYRDIKGEFVKGPLTEIVEHALDNPDLPHFVLLDEMNLARVEYYFSDVLSVMESRKKDGKGRFSSSPLLPSYDESLTLPGNLYVIGTVNMDETTYSFSKKVLDRANTIEFNEIDLLNFDSMMDNEPIEPIRVSNDVLESTYIHLKDAFQTHEALIRKVSEKINTINDYLVPIHAQVGYRVRDEISFYMAHNTEGGMLLTENEAMDFCMMQKILPRISGTESVVRPVLKNLEEELKQYPKCTAKITEMIARLDDHGFVSFWTA